MPGAQATPAETVIVIELDVAELVPFVTPIVKVAAPAVVGVPDRTPVEGASDSPAGREPLATLQVNPLLGVAWKVYEGYAEPAVAVVLGACAVMASEATGLIVMLKIGLVAVEIELVAVTWNAKVPDWVGVPLRMPALLRVVSVTPLGNVLPAESAQVMGLAPPAVN